MTMKNGLIYLLYDSMEQVKRGWNSILQAKHPLCIHVIDNASTDGCADMLEQSGVPVHRNPTNTGFTKAINDGLKAMLEKDVEWIFILNPDTVCPPNWDALMVDTLTASKQVGIVGSRLVDGYGNILHTGGIVGKPQLIFWSSNYPLGHGTWGIQQREAVCTTRFRHRITECKTAEETAWVSFAAVAIRAEMVREIGLLDEQFILYASDSEYCVRARAAGWQVWVNPQATFKHEGSANVKQAGSKVQQIAQADLKRFASMEDDLYGRTDWKADCTRRRDRAIGRW